MCNIAKNELEVKYDGKSKDSHLRGEYSPYGDLLFFFFFAFSGKKKKKKKTLSGWMKKDN